MCPEAGEAVESRTAVIWIGGLTTTAERQSPEATARRLAAALEHPAPASTNFSVERRDEVSTIVRSDAEGSRAVIDVFGLDAKQRLLGPIEQRGPLKQALIGLGVVAVATPVLLRRLRGSTGKAPRERRQLAAAVLMLTVMAIGVPILLAAGAAALSDKDIANLPAVASVLVAAAAGFGFWKSPPARALRRMAVTLYALYRYVERADESSAEIRGELAKLVDDVQNRLGVAYHRIVVLAYSFGSLAAIDALLSPTSPPPARLADVDELVTLGCPMDLIRAFRPDYVGVRHALDGAPGHWTNVYAPSDVLASNFRDGMPPDERPFAIPLRDGGFAAPDNVDYLIDGRREPVGVAGTLLLRGFRLHGRYWSDEVAAADSVFGTVLPHITGTPAAV